MPRNELWTAKKLTNISEYGRFPTISPHKIENITMIMTHKLHRKWKLVTCKHSFSRLISERLRDVTSLSECMLVKRFWGWFLRIFRENFLFNNVLFQAMSKSVYDKQKAKRSLSFIEYNGSTQEISNCFFPFTIDMRRMLSFKSGWNLSEVLTKLLNSWMSCALMCP